MCKKLICLICFVLLLGLDGSISASYNQWDGSESSDWNTAANWAANAVPSFPDKAGFKTGTNGPIIGSSTPTCDEWTLGGAQGGLVTINSGGSVQTIGRVSIAQSSSENGTLNMNGGTATFGGNLDLGYAGTGHINLDGGTINAADFAMRAKGGVGTMNITAGMLIINGDKTSLISGYVNSGWITAYNGAGTVESDYNVTNPGKTTVKGTSGGGTPSQANNPASAN
jgi:hypothetical protein